MKSKTPEKETFLFSLLTGILFSLFSISRKLCETSSGAGLSFRPLIFLPVYAVLFTALVYGLFRLGRRFSQMLPGPMTRYLPRLKRAEYRAILLFLLFLLAYAPSFLAVCPGIFNYDGPDQVYDFLNPEIRISTHHPPAHTCLLGLCFRLGLVLTGSYSWGLFFYSLLQWFFSAAAFTYLFVWMEHRKTPVWIRTISFFYLILNPFIHCLLFSTTKDTISAAFFLLLFLKLLDLAQAAKSSPDIEKSRKQPVLLLLFAVGMSLFRNPGFYILAFTLAVFILLLPRKRRLLLTLGAAALISWFFMRPFPDLLGLRKGDPREMFSLPMQQIAAVWNQYAAGQAVLSQEEAAHIEALIPPDVLDDYLPSISDPVKAGFQTQVLTENPGYYLRLYLRLGLRCPRTYLRAFMDLFSGYWIPGWRFERWYHLYSDTAPGPLADFCVVQRFQLFPAGWSLLVQSVDYVNSRPIPSALFGPALSVWLMSACLIRCAVCRRREQFAACSLLLGQAGILLLGPAALIRYAYPLMLCIPPMLTLLFEQPETAVSAGS